MKKRGIIYRNRKTLLILSIGIIEIVVLQICSNLTYKCNILYFIILLLTVINILLFICHKKHKKRSPFIPLIKIFAPQNLTLRFLPILLFTLLNIGILTNIVYELFDLNSVKMDWCTSVHWFLKVNKFIGILLLFFPLPFLSVPLLSADKEEKLPGNKADCKVLFVADSLYTDNSPTTNTFTIDKTNSDFNLEYIKYNLAVERGNDDFGNRVSPDGDYNFDFSVENLVTNLSFQEKAKELDRMDNLPVWSIQKIVREYPNLEFIYLICSPEVVKQNNRIANDETYKLCSTKEILTFETKGKNVPIEIITISDVNNFRLSFEELKSKIDTIILTKTKLNSFTDKNFLFSITTGTSLISAILAILSIKGNRQSVYHMQKELSFNTPEEKLKWYKNHANKSVYEREKIKQKELVPIEIDVYNIEELWEEMRAKVEKDLEDEENKDNCL